MKHSYLMVGLAVLGLAGVLGAAAPGPENFAVVIGDAHVCKSDPTDAVVQAIIDVNLVFKVGEVQGYSFGICTGDESVAKGVAPAVKDADLGEDVKTAKCGEMAQFKRINYLAGGVTMGLVVDFDALCKLPATASHRAARITYNVLAAPVAAADCTPQFTTDLTLCGTLGKPVVAAVAVVNGVSIPFGGAENKNGQITVGYQAEPIFVRSDPNADARLDIADGIWILNALFFSDRYPDNQIACADAADANDDGQLDASDAMFIFNWQFMDGPAPAAPLDGCGKDPTADGLPKCVYEACP